MFACYVTDELQLRVLEVRHADEIFAVVDRNRAHLRRWLPWVDGNRSADGTRAFCESAMKQFAAGNGFHAGMWAKGNFIGVIGLHWIDRPNRRTSIGYWLDKSAEGRGWMTAACRAMVDHALIELDLNRVEIRCATQNPKSLAIPRRLGFTHEGTVRQVEWLYDHFVDHEIYGMLKEQWEAMTAKQ
jgi:ribosomal-protein-serine acetyltransferase